MCRGLKPVDRHRVKTERGVLLREAHRQLEEIARRLQSTGDTGPWPAEAWSSWGKLARLAREIEEVAHAAQLKLADPKHRSGTPSA